MKNLFLFFSNFKNKFYLYFSFLIFFILSGISLKFYFEKNKLEKENILLNEENKKIKVENLSLKNDILEKSNIIENCITKLEKYENIVKKMKKEKIRNNIFSNIYQENENNLNNNNLNNSQNSKNKNLYSIDYYSILESKGNDYNSSQKINHLNNDDLYNQVFYIRKLREKNLILIQDLHKELTSCYSKLEKYEKNINFSINKN